MILLALGILFLLLGYLTQHWYEGLYQVLLYLVMWCSIAVPERIALFWKETGEMDLEKKWGGEGLGRVEGSENAMFCIGEE